MVRQYLCPGLAPLTSGEPVSLTVVGRVLAGEPFDRAIDSGEAVRIMTGGPVPRGADSVVRVEHTDREEVSGTIQILEGGDVGRNVRPGGQDWEEGNPVLSAGAMLTAGRIGVLAAAGVAEPAVFKRPRVGLLPTGDELFDITTSHPSGAVPESNSHALAAQAIEAGADPVRLPIAVDEDAALRGALAGASTFDALVTIGGASMGEGDRVKRVLDQMGYSSLFWRVRIRPGSPFSFGLLPTDSGHVPVFGLPGNPASAFVTFEVFVRPFLRRIGGFRETRRPTVRLRAGEAMHTAAHLTQYLRVRLEDGPRVDRVYLAGPQGSGLVSSLGIADGLAVVPENVETVQPGESVDVMLLSGNV